MRSLAAALLGSVVVVSPAFAQDGGSSEPASKANYAFASQLGAGVYNFTGGSVHVYRIGGAVGLRSVDDDGWGLKVQIPVTIGLYDFGPLEVLESGLPDRIGTLALVPEIRFEFPLRENWRIMPFGAAGAGRDFSADQFNYILTAGIRSVAAFDSGSFRLFAGNRLFYSGYTASKLDLGGDFAGLDSVLDLRHNLGFGLGDHRVDGGVFVANYLYLVSPELFRFDAQSLNVDVQWELGVTLGTTTPIRFLGLTLPKIGISRRMGSGVSTFRLVMGGPLT